MQSINKNSSVFNAWEVKPKSIAISILVLFILISGIAVFWGYWQYKQSGAYLLSADKTNSTFIADNITEYNNTVLQTLLSYAQKQSFIDAAKKKGAAEAQKQLALLKNTMDFDRAIITDKSGIVRATFPASSVGSILSYRDWYKGVSANWQPHVSSIFQVMTGDKPFVVAFSVPILDEKGNPSGILTIYKKLDFIADLTKRVSLDQLTALHVTDQTGNILFGNKPDFKKKVTGYALFPVIQKALTENKKQVEIQDQKRNQAVSYLSIAMVEGTGWLVIVQRDFQDNLRLQPASSPAAIIIIFVLLFITISIFLIYFRNIIVFKREKAQLLATIKLLQDEKIDWEKRYHLENRGNQKNIPLIVWDHDLVIVRFDQAFEKMTGWSKEEVIGKKIDVLFPENSKKESLDRINTAAKSEKTEVLEVPILHSDGKTAIARGHYVTVRKQDEQEIIILNAKLEKRVLERTANLEAANRRLEAFSYSISHALLTPMQTIENLCVMMSEKYHKKPDDADNNYPERISREIKRMGQLIDDMQKLSHLNRIDISRQNIDVSKMVQEIMEEYRQKYLYREVSVTIEKDIIINGDELLLKIALENLIGNAWKFTESLERATIKFGATSKEGKTVLFIRDNGIGFDIMHVNKLFSAFNRIDKHTEFSGTGIGLAAVQRIVDRHGGEIWAESKPGKGATFYFTLSPLHQTF